MWPQPLSEDGSGGWGPGVVREGLEVRMPWNNGNHNSKAELSGKELASVVREAQAEGLLRDRSAVGDRAPGPGLGWSGRLA